MKNTNQTNPPTSRRRPRRIETSQPRPTHQWMPKAPHHDLLVLGFYPGMGRSLPIVDHPTAA